MNPKQVESPHPMLLQHSVEGTYSNTWHQCKIFYERTEGQK